jgi:PA-IL-like protein
MVRRVISTVVLVASAGLYTLTAAERATVVLTNGERRSGEVVATGNDNAAFVGGQFRLIENGQEQSIPIEQVAVIDFTGGTPSPLELSRVAPNTGGQTAIMRSGHAQGGKFVNIIRGDTLLWENGRGQQEQYPIRDVSRVYLNPASARTVYNVERDRGGVAVGTGTTGSLTGGTTINVLANVPWTDSGITVNAGDRVMFQASGTINYGQSAGQTATPDGGGERRAGYPDPTVPVGALIGKVGNNGKPFAIGSQRQALGMPASGRLFLGVNDNERTDNSGAFTVIVARQ